MNDPNTLDSNIETNPNQINNLVQSLNKIDLQVPPNSPPNSPTRLDANNKIKAIKKKSVRKPAVAKSIILKPVKVKNVQKIFGASDINTPNVTVDEINNLTLKNTKEFSFDGIITYGKVLRVHDGDTITIGFKYNDIYYKKNLRIANIDAPELHSQNVKESLACRLGRNYLASIIMNKVIIVHMSSLDKYGRILSELYTMDGIHLNDLMIQKKYVRYYGSEDLHKGPWTEEEIDAILNQAAQDGIEDSG
jgi:endonuclease YncB( thermonuclease family)